MFALELRPPKHGLTTHLYVLVHGLKVFGFMVNHLAGHFSGVWGLEV